MSYETRLFINGEYVQGSSGETLTIHSPNDDSLVTDKIQVASEQDVDKAVAAARAAFPAWRDMAGHKRAAIMNKFADLLEANIEKLAKLESAAMGQPVSVAKRMILGPVALWRYYAGYVLKLYVKWEGSLIISLPGTLARLLASRSLQMRTVPTRL